jgi:hypothetical protein
MWQAATMAGNAENKAATFADITGVIKGVTAVAWSFTGLPIGIGEAPGGKSIGDPTVLGSPY